MRCNVLAKGIMHFASMFCPHEKLEYKAIHVECSGTNFYSRDLNLTFRFLNKPEMDKIRLQVTEASAEG
jgi:hypothetical protein